MAKHPHQERVTDDTTPGAGERNGREELGPGAKLVRRARPEGAAAGPRLSMQEYLRQQGETTLGRANTDLHARDEEGRPIPTLAERIALQGFDVAMHGERKGKRK